MATSSSFFLLGPSSSSELIPPSPSPGRTTFCLLFATFSCRTAELREHRRAGVFQDLDDYIVAASCLPTDLPLYYKAVDHQPQGYREEVYGPWPGPSWILKLRLAPSWKSFLDDTNWHTITALITRGPNPNNILLLGPLLSCVFAILCDCMAGMKTNSCCAHALAEVKAVLAPACFRSRKVNEALMTDIYR